jgi:hypothetical protein
VRNFGSRVVKQRTFALKDLQKMLLDENHATTLALKALGVTCGSEGRGGKATSFLVKTV